MPSSRPLRADARRNRDALLVAAREAFLADDDAHVEVIARRAGVSVGTLYRHFDTREALVAEVYRQEVAEPCAPPPGCSRDTPRTRHCAPSCCCSWSTRQWAE